jgi:hypothetical protein
MPLVGIEAHKIVPANEIRKSSYSISTFYTAYGPGQPGNFVYLYLHSRLATYVRYK